MSDAPFPDAPRVDAFDKVRGAPLYAADHTHPQMAHAALAVATIGKGRVTSLDTAAARAVPGVRLILTHEDLAYLQKPGFIFGGGFAFQNLQVLTSPDIAYRGQPIALVAADSCEAAVEAASRVRAQYDPQPFNVTLDAPEADIIAQADSYLPKEMFGDRIAGDADAAFAAAEVKIDAAYSGPPNHHNPIELLSCVAEWRDGVLVVHEGTQNAEGLRHGLAQVLGVAAEQVQVVSPYAGGGFGQKNSLQMHTALAAVAAQKLGRPVKVVVPRAQIFHDASFRPASRHRIRLGADRAGRLTAAIHESDSQTSHHDLFPTMHADTTARLYGFGAFRGHERLVRTDVQTPGFMRGPWEHIACFAMEAAIDEMAYALNQDPVALRLANDVTGADLLTGLPLSSRHVAECLTRGAARFGWERRSMAPGSMQADDGSAIGWGVAVGCYPGAVVPQIAHLEVTDAGAAVIRIGGHEMGQGIRTMIAALVTRRLGVAPERLTIAVGDTRAAPQHLTAGSWGTASAAPATELACDELAKALRALEPNAEVRDFPAVLKRVGRPSLSVEVRYKAPGAPDAAFDQLQSGRVSLAGPLFPDFLNYSYIAHFVEVRIEPRLRRIRVPRVVSVVDCGRVVSPRTAESQVRGGVVWGVGAAMREASEVDPRYGGFLNADLAEYVIPVNADIGSIEVEFIDKPDPKLNSLGVKSLGEVVLSGVAPAITNAVYHATGRRVRDLPVRIEHIL